MKLICPELNNNWNRIYFLQSEISLICSLSSDITPVAITMSVVIKRIMILMNYIIACFLLQDNTV